MRGGGEGMSAIDTFRRAMRRHEKRAREMGLHGVEVELSVARANPDNERISFAWLHSWAKSFTGHETQHRGTYRRAAFIYALAASAVARLRAGLAEEERRAQQEEDERPYVCPGCYAVGGEPCAPGCIDAAMEREREERDMYGDEEDDIFDADERAMVATWDEVLP